MSQLATDTSSSKNKTVQEILILIAIAFLWFIGTSFGRNSEGINWNRLVFIGNYLLVALIINFFLLPRFYYQRKLLYFVIGCILAVLLGMLCEEFILEPLLYPDTRGSEFRGSIFMMIRMLPFIMLFVGFKFAWDAQARQRELEQLRRLVSESELQFLKSQVNPHFLFNSLNNLYSYALESSPRTPEIILI